MLFGCWTVPEGEEVKKIHNKVKEKYRKNVSGIKYHTTAIPSFTSSLKKKKKSKMLLHICNSNKVPFPSAPHPSLIAHLDISKEKHAQLSAEIKARRKQTKKTTWQTWQENKMLTSNIHLPSNWNLTKPQKLKVVQITLSEPKSSMSLDWQNKENKDKYPLSEVRLLSHSGHHYHHNHL